MVVITLLHLSRLDLNFGYLSQRLLPSILFSGCSIAVFSLSLSLSFFLSHGCIRQIACQAQTHRSSISPEQTHISGQILIFLLNKKKMQRIGWTDGRRSRTMLFSILKLCVPTINDQEKRKTRWNQNSIIT